MIREQAIMPLMNMLREETVQSVVHDLRSPLTVIKGYLQLLLSGVMGSMPEEQLQLIQRSVGPLEDLILLTENLLYAPALERQHMELKLAMTNLDQLITETIDFYQLSFQQRHMQLLREGNTLGAQILADPFWIKRVLHNLVWNAFKFTPDHGKVSIHVRSTPGKNEGLEIVVLDTGRGIPTDKLETIFEKRSQVSPVRDRELGSGLGLWICKRVMQLHGGTIRVTSQENRGSQFILFLPAARASIVQAHA